MRSSSWLKRRVSSDQRYENTRMKIRFRFTQPGMDWTPEEGEMVILTKEVEHLYKEPLSC